MSKPKAIAVVGPTSSGKTSLAITLAKQFNGEVISADCRQIYKGLDLGTGKVTAEEMDGVTHHLIDIADPNKRYSASEFELDATAAIMDIRSRHKLPIVAGGTFFYLDMLRGRHGVAHVPPNEAFRIDMSDFSTPELFSKLQASDPDRASTIDRHNRPRLIRALEIIESLGKVPPPQKTDSPFEWLVIGISISQLRLHDNIHKRLHQRLDAGMVEEVEKLHAEGLSYERMHDLGIEYRFISSYLKGEIRYKEMVEKIGIKSRQFAKRQMTWLKKDKEIEWFDADNKPGICHRVSEFLEQSSELT
tara:strand:+ start:7384 stop:8295 length:912 start_codon:yes stop_codon:yes gene_type:complete